MSLPERPHARRSRRLAKDTLPDGITSVSTSSRSRSSNKRKRSSPEPLRVEEQPGRRTEEASREHVADGSIQPAPRPQDGGRYAAVLDHAAFPHIFDAILSHIPPESALSLRATSRSLRNRLDTLAAQHISVHGLDTGKACICSPHGQRLAAFAFNLELLGHTRTIDVHGHCGYDEMNIFAGLCAAAPNLAMIRYINSGAPTFLITRLVPKIVLFDAPQDLQWIALATVNLPFARELVQVVEWGAQPVFGYSFAVGLLPPQLQHITLIFKPTASKAKRWTDERMVSFVTNGLLLRFPTATRAITKQISFTLVGLADMGSKARPMRLQDYMLRRVTEEIVKRGHGHNLEGPVLDEALKFYSMKEYEQVMDPKEFALEMKPPVPACPHRQPHRQIERLDCHHPASQDCRAG